MSAFLRLNIDDTQTTIDIEDTSNFPVNGGVIEVESEKISYTTATPQGILGCTRGYDGTSAASHLAKEIVDLLTTPLNTAAPLEFSASGAPTDNLTGVKIAPIGSHYTDSATGDVYINTGDADEPVWSLLSMSDVGAVWGNITGDLDDQTDLQAALDSKIEGVAWGDITGTLSAQTDLQTALDAKLETVVASDVDSEAATTGQVLTADGMGGATWEDGGSGGAVVVADIDSEASSDKQVIMSNGAGGATWEDIPAGSTTEIQFNDASVLGADSRLFFDKATGHIRLGTGVTVVGDELPFIGGSDCLLRFESDVNHGYFGSLGTEMNLLAIEGFTIKTDYTGSQHTWHFNDDASMTTPGNLGVNAPSIDPSARLQVDSTGSGFLPPRMTETQRDAISSPAAGLMIYNTTTSKLNVYTNAWETITSV